MAHVPATHISLPKGKPEGGKVLPSAQKAKTQEHLVNNISSCHKIDLKNHMVQVLLFWSGKAESRDASFANGAIAIQWQVQKP